MASRLKSISTWLKLHLRDANMPLVIFILFLLAMGIMARETTVSRRIGPEAVHGYLYCSNIDNRYPVMLRGQWEYYENVFLFSSDFNYLGRSKAGYTPAYVKVPGPAPNPYGFGTYRLTFKCITRSQLFALKTQDIRSSSRIYVDGNLIGAIGDPSTLTKGSIQWNAPQFIVFPMDTLRTTHEIIIQTSNYNYFQSGITSPLYFGTQTEVYQLSNQAKLSNAIAVMSIFVLATFLLFLLPLRIRLGNMKYLLLFSIFFGLFLLTAGEKILLPMSGNDCYVLYTRFTLSLYVAMSLSMALYINVQAGQAKPYRWIRNFAVAGGILLVASLFFSPQAAQGTTVTISEVFVILLSLLSAVRLFIRLLERSYSALYQMLGLLCWVGLLIAYFIYDRGMISSANRDFLLILLVFGFLVFQIMYISRHIATIYSANEHLAQRMVISDKLKDDFMEITSHELRTPLHGIINITQSVVEKLKGRTDLIYPKSRGDLELVVSLARRMSGIVNDMYHFVSNSGDTETKLRPTDLRLEVKAALEVFSYTTDTTKIRFVNRISSRASTVYADERKLWQVLNNLIGNAVKYTDSGTITLESRLVEGMVYVSVIDTGIGMPMESASGIFEKSARLPSGAMHAEGRGLGLYIARKLVEDMGGRIFVEWTEPSKGTRITFTLKKCDKETYSRMRPEEEDVHFRSTHAQIEQQNLIWPSNARILMADDNPDNLKVVRDMFTEANIIIDTVQDGQTAINLLEKQSYDIVILDVMMPGMSGFEACRIIREQYSIFELPVLMLTARDASEDILTGFWAGANDYVIKPVDSIELRARVFTLINLKRSVSVAIKNELNFLQAQIRPHFLYNAFNTISAIALSDGAAASELIDDLSIYLRHCFRGDSQEELVTIGDELELVNAYLRIEKARFGDRLEISDDIEPDLQFYLPALTIQPIVENAVRHGSLNSYQTTRVQIRLFRENGDAVIEVTDNGRGIDVDKIQSMLGGGEEGKGSGIGLTNVNRRLKLRYNRTLKIENTDPPGTRVTLRIPLESDVAAAKQ